MLEEKGLNDIYITARYFLLNPQIFIFEKNHETFENIMFIRIWIQVFEIGLGFGGRSSKTIKTVIHTL